MREIIYDVATSLDGFIAGPGDDIAGFVAEGDHVAAYQARLASYGTAIMGRRTYEFGYRFGLVPGARAWPHMDHHVFSRSLVLPGDAVEVVRGAWRERLEALRGTPGRPIYLCGGGVFAGWLAAEGLIDRLRLKINPVVLGGGLPLFAGLTAPLALRPVGLTAHASGVTLAEFVAARHG
jgi:dihydrofolate reductase